MDRIAAELNTRATKMVESVQAREEGMEGVQAAALAGIVGGAVIILAGLVTGKIQELWARVNGG